jgi:hypothetical protein
MGEQCRSRSAHTSVLSRIFTICFFVRNNLMNEISKCNSRSDKMNVLADLDLYLTPMDYSHIPRRKCSKWYLQFIKSIKIKNNNGGGCQFEYSQTCIKQPPKKWLLNISGCLRQVNFRKNVSLGHIQTGCLRQAGSAVLLYSLPV